MFNIYVKDSVISQWHQVVWYWSQEKKTTNARVLLVQAGQLEATNKTRILLKRRTTSWLLYGLLEQQSVTISVGIYNPLFSIPEGISSTITKVEMVNDIYLQI